MIHAIVFILTLQGFPFWAGGGRMCVCGWLQYTTATFIFYSLAGI